MSKSLYKQIVETYYATHRAREEERAMFAGRRENLFSQLQRELTLYLGTGQTRLVHVDATSEGAAEARLFADADRPPIVTVALAVRDVPGGSLAVSVDHSDAYVAETSEDLGVICKAIAAVFMAKAAVAAVPAAARYREVEQ
jgi:hypothetical protein